MGGSGAKAGPVTADMPAVADLDAMNAVVLSGDGVVMRFPGLLCLLWPGIGVASVDDAHLEQLSAICAAVSADTPAAPARLLARKLAIWLGSAEEVPHFGTVAATGTGIGVFLFGSVDAQVGTSRLSGAESGAWLDRLLPHPDGPIALIPTHQPTPEPAAGRAGFDLRGGVVPGGGVVLVSASGAVPLQAVSAAPALAVAAPLPVANARERSAAGVGASGAAPPERVDAQPGPDEIPGAGIPSGQQPELRAPRRAEAIFGVAPDEQPREPLDSGGHGPSSPVKAPPPPAGPPPVRPGRGPAGKPAARAAQAEPPPSEGAEHAPVARGFKCSRDHLNDPRNQFCLICGIRMDERTGIVVLGIRPPLGLLVFDDGSTYTVDADYLLGRMPESDPRVQSGELRPLPVQDPGAQLSRGHLVIKLSDWDVTAIDESSNGTYVARSAEQSWSRLAPRSPLRLEPGIRIRVGTRSFIFESPSGVR